MIKPGTIQCGRCDLARPNTVDHCPAGCIWYRVPAQPAPDPVVWHDPFDDPEPEPDWSAVARHFNGQP